MKRLVVGRADLDFETLVLVPELHSLLNYYAYTLFIKHLCILVPKPNVTNRYYFIQLLILIIDSFFSITNK